ncbi:MAG: hypothetical protein ACE5R6_01055 [Candidatus Heimdallarchaeota archaeon]
MNLFGLMKDIVYGLTKLKFGKKLSGRQRTLLALMGKIPDRIPLACGIANINPFWVNPSKYDYFKLVNDPKLSLEFIQDLMELIPDIDWWGEPWLGGVMLSEGACECGTIFEFPRDTFAYPIKYPVNEAKDLDALHLQLGGYLENYIETLGLVRDEFPNLLFPPLIPCPWTLGTFLREADRLIQDFILYKNYIETESAARRRKLERRAQARAIDPLFWECEMEVFLNLCFEVRDRHKEAGTLGFGTTVYDLYGSPPNLDIEAYAQYVYPFTKEILRGLQFSPLIWQPTSPEEINHMKQIFKGLLIGNLGYEIDEYGLFSRKFDESTIDVAKGLKSLVAMNIAPDFLRDADVTQIQEYSSHLCALAIKKRVPALFSIIGIAAHTPRDNVRATINVVLKEGYYT